MLLLTKLFTLLYNALALASAQRFLKYWAGF